MRSGGSNVLLCAALVVLATPPASAATPESLTATLDGLVARENQGRKVQEAPVVDDLAYLRRITVDIIGRIPTGAEIDRYLGWPAAERRVKAVDLLMKDDRFADRWTIFYADLLRLRANATGGGALTAFVNRAVASGMPYDEMCRKLISANGKADAVGEVGFILGDDADPMALAGATAQVFLGIRVACAQCHNHPFATWKREQFYGLAAYFGKTRRVESKLTKAIYTTEVSEMSIRWPPEDKANGKERKPVVPTFPFALDAGDGPSQHIARLEKLRAELLARQQKNPAQPTVDDLLGDAGAKAQKRASGEKTEELNVLEEARLAAQKLKVKDDIYKASVLRYELASAITNPRNRAFSRNLVNRVWAELLGRGFVEPVDDFREENPPSHPQALDFLADEFVASGYDLRTVVRLIVSSKTYQRGHLPPSVSPAIRLEAEKAFTALPTRRLLSEVLYDSIVQAGNLFQVKHAQGENLKTVRSLVREAVKVEGEPGKEVPKKTVMVVKPAQPSGYDLENALELAYDPTKAAKGEPSVDMMRKVSQEELEAERMLAEKKGTGAKMKYVERMVETTVDDNPRYISSTRMASPAPPAHFLRVFGQPARNALGDHRDHSASMRQALMMLNGKLTHEASRVGTLEPIYPHLVGPKADLSKAIRLAYLEILTREPTADELADGKTILAGAASPRDGMADLRWALLNCHEFLFLP